MSLLFSKSSCVFPSELKNKVFVMACPALRHLAPISPLTSCSALLPLARPLQPSQPTCCSLKVPDTSHLSILCCPCCRECSSPKQPHAHWLPPAGLCSNPASERPPLAILSCWKQQPFSPPSQHSSRASPASEPQHSPPAVMYWTGTGLSDKTWTPR